MAQKKKRRAIFVIGEKGGSGKTTFARALLDRMRRDKKTVAAYDGDGAVGQFFQYYGQRDEEGQLLTKQSPTEGVVPFDVRDDHQRDTLMNVLDETDHPDAILVDLPGGSLPEMKRLFAGGAPALMQEYASEGFTPVIVVVMSPLLGSARSVKEAIDEFGTVPEYVAVKNLGFGEAADFILFDGYTDPESEEVRGGKGKAALEWMDGAVVEMPYLKSRTYALMDLYSLSFSGAVSDRRLTRADRSRVQHWMKTFDDALDSAKSILGTG